MKLVVLDADTVTSGDVSLEPIKELFDECEVYGFTEESEIINRLKDADAVLCNKSVINRSVFEKCENLKFVGLFATGYNNIDCEAAKAHGCVVCNVPGYSTNAVAQHVFALLLNYFSKVSEYDKTVKEDVWIKSKLFSYFNLPVSEICGKKFGIIGFGNIGKAVAKIALAFGMKVLVYTRTKPEGFSDIEIVDFDTLLKESDILSLHCPLTPDTKELINKETLKKMKKTAVIVNTSRGGVINEYDLASALKEGKIEAALLDVLTYEPMREDCPLRFLENCTFTPHIAWAPIETRERLIDLVKENIIAFKKGMPINVVNK